MKIKVISTKTQPGKNDTAVLFAAKGAKPYYPGALSELSEMIDPASFKGDASETLFIPFRETPNILICGLGDSAKIDSETIRKSASAAVKAARAKSVKHLHFYPPELKEMTDTESAASIAEGAMLADYSFRKYKSQDENDRDHPLDSVSIVSEDKKAAAALKESVTICENVNLCRDMVNETSDNCNPETMADYARKMAKKAGIRCRVYKKRELEKMGMNLLLAVNRGGEKPANLIVLEYRGAGPKTGYTALAGKGITFDSGGINIKQSGHIENMRMDMAGAAAVIHTIKAAAEIKLKANLYAVVPVTENFPGSAAYRPGDVFKSYSGKTVEIGNTDAEGRLILADALAFIEDKLKPERIIDIATLTGACVATFGEHSAGYLSNNDKLASLIEDASRHTGERIWRLPFFPEYDENLKSDIADLINISTEKNAGTIIGGVFLKNFISKTEWAHIDIAGTAWFSKERDYRPKNGTGYGVRLLVELIKRIS